MKRHYSNSNELLRTQLLCMPLQQSAIVQRHLVTRVENDGFYIVGLTLLVDVDSAVAILLGYLQPRPREIV